MDTKMRTETAGISGILPGKYRLLMSKARLAGSDLATVWRGEMERVADGGAMGSALAHERCAIIATLRIECAQFGDQDWEDDLHISDIIEKHLMRPASRRIAELEQALALAQEIE